VPPGRRDHDQEIIMSIRTPDEIRDLLQRLRRERPYLQRGEIPPEIDLSKAPILDNWAFSIEPRRRLIGTVTGHPRLPDGWITTSPLVWIDPDRGVARTISRYYRLGRPLGTASDQ
jgi:hypothetical protein